MRAFADHLRQERARAEVRRAPAPLFAQRAAQRGNCACGGGCPRCAAGPALQPKLAVSQPADFEERQADSVAEQVMRAAAPNDGARVDGAAPSQVDAARGGGGGRPLAPPVREFFEPRFGHGFGDVRVHTDAQAARSARGLGALAYTVGTDMVFAEGQYAPETQAGRTLLAHELAHVVQQRDGAQRVQRKVTPGCTSEEASAITSAVSQARTDLGKVINLLAESTLSPAVKNAMWLAFRVDSDFMAKKVITDKLALLRDNIEDADYTCVNNKHPRYAEKCETEEKTYGFVSGSDVNEEGAREFAGPINFCMPRFANYPKFQQVRAVVHEASHRFLNALDLGYFTTQGDLSVPQCQETARQDSPEEPNEAKSGTAGDIPYERLMNADAIACFVYFAVYAPADFVTSTANQYRGGELRITTETRAPGSEEVVGDIYTQTGAPGEPTFRITGEPDMGRFQYRWSFEAGGNSYSPLARRGTTAATFDARNTEVHIGPGARSTLDGRGVTEGTLVCEAQLVKPFDPDLANVKRVEKVLKIRQGQDPYDPSR